MTNPASSAFFQAAPAITATSTTAPMAQPVVGPTPATNTTTTATMSPEQFSQAMQQMFASMSQTASPTTSTPNSATNTSTAQANSQDPLTRELEALMEEFGKLFTTVFDGTVNSSFKEIADQVAAEVARNKKVLSEGNVVPKLSQLLGEMQKLLSTNKAYIEEMLARFIQVAKESLAQSPWMPILRISSAADPNGFLESLKSSMRPKPPSGAAQGNVSSTLAAA